MSTTGTQTERGSDAKTRRRGDGTPLLLVSAAAFLKWHRRAAYRHAKRALFLDFLRWYNNDGRLGIVRLHGRIVAMALARCVHSVAEASHPFAHQEAAPIVWVDEIVSTHPAGVAQLFLQVERRFGERQILAGRVFNRDGKLRMLPYRVLQRLITGEHAHGLTFTSRTTRAA